MPMTLGVNEAKDQCHPKTSVVGTLVTRATSYPNGSRLIAWVGHGQVERTMSATPSKVDIGRAVHRPP